MGVEVGRHGGGGEERDPPPGFLGGGRGQGVGEGQSDLARPLRLTADEAHGTDDGVAGREGVVEVHGGTEADLQRPLPVLQPVVLRDAQLQPVGFGEDHAVAEGEGGPLDGMGEHHAWRGLVGSWGLI